LWGGTPVNSSYIESPQSDYYIPFLNSPEWVMNNFYLLDLGPAYVNGKIENHVTPAMLFESEAKTLIQGMALNGFGYAKNDFWRREH